MFQPCVFLHFNVFLSEKFGNQQNITYLCDNLNAKRLVSLQCAKRRVYD